MLTILLFLILLSSGSIFASTYFNTKYEDTVSITSICFVILSFLLGMVNLLRYAFAAICAIAIILYVLTIYKIIKDKSIKKLIKNTFTPAFFILIILCAAFTLGTYGKLFDLNDEFSHWGDIVKVMVDIGDFGTNPNSGSLFKSYPPGMSIFQYLLERTNYCITGNSFTEWLCYYGYDVFCVIVLLPLFSKIQFRNITGILAIMATIFCIPCIFIYTWLLSLQIEIFLGFVICSLGLQMLFYDNSLLSFFRITSMLAMLVLAKDSGLLFAIFFAIGFIVIWMLNNKEKSIRNKSITFVSVVASVSIPKLLWELDIRMNNAVKSFNNEFDFTSLVNVFNGSEVSYRKQVFNNFIDQMVDGHITFGLTTKVPHFAIVGIGIFCIIIVSALAKHFKQADNKNVVIARITLITSAVIFISGMCITYMYKFSEEEALILAAFQRYISTIYISFSLFTLLGLVIIINNCCEKKEILNSLIICSVIFITHIGDIVYFGFGTSATLSQQIRQEYYQGIVDKTNKITQNSKIWFIEIEETSEDRLVYKYCVRPNMVDGEWSIRTSLEEDDVYSTEKSISEWRNDLLEGDYDYVALFTVDDVFINQYAFMFEKPEEIQNMCIYSFDSDTGLLSLCE